MMRTQSSTLVLAATIFTLLSVHSYAQTSVWGNMWGAAAWWGDLGVGVRPPQGVNYTVPVTDTFYYSVAPNSTLYAMDWRNRGTVNWTSVVVPGINVTIPILNVEQNLNISSNAIYFLNVVDGRLYSFNADPAVNRTGPVWVSDFICSTVASQAQQVMTINTAAGLLASRCGSDIVLTRLSDGKLHMRVKNSTADPVLPIPFATTQGLATVSGNRIVVRSTRTPGVINWVATVGPPESKISSIAPGQNILAVSAEGSLTINFISTTGRALSNWTFNFNDTNMMNSSILPRPTIHKGVLYGIAVGLRDDPSGVDIPKLVWANFAVNVTDARAPALIWQGNTTVGIPPKQAVTVTKEWVLVSLPGSRQWNLYQQADGRFAWGNPRVPSYPRSLTTPGLATVPYCCDFVFVASTTSSASTRDNAMLAFRLARPGVPVFDLGLCTCTV